MWRELVQEWLRITGRTQRDLAELAEMHEANLSKLLKGVGNPDVQTLSKLERAMRMVPGRLLIAAAQEPNGEPAGAARE